MYLYQEPASAKTSRGAFMSFHPLKGSLSRRFETYRQFIENQIFTHSVV